VERRFNPRPPVTAGETAERTFLRTLLAKEAVQVVGIVEKKRWI